VTHTPDARTPETQTPQTQTPQARTPEAAFTANRSLLVGVAYRLLGSVGDAEDVVQEAWLRLDRAGGEPIDNLAAWLTAVVSRLCIDVLRSRRARPVADIEDSLLDLVVTEDVEPGPEERAVLADSVGRALLAVLEELTPDERLAFVLHDTFAVPFEQIGGIIGRTTDATKMLASRARAKVRRRPGDTATRKQQREVVDAFLAAARDGDFDRLLEVLDPGLTWRMHTARGVLVRSGAQELAKRARVGGNGRITARRVLVDGEPGVLAWTGDGTPLALMACIIEGDRIIEVESIADPRNLAALDLPPRDPPPPVTSGAARSS
jgi:RNA polymerase sigma-70 factor (ECF subfamily)